MKNINAQLNAAKLAKITHTVTQNSTLSPYMLFPVRLETHFREISVSDRPSHETELEEIYRAFSEIIQRFHTLILSQKTNTDTYSDTLPETLYDIKEKIDELDLVAPETKNYLRNIAYSFQKEIRKMSHLPEVKPLIKYVDEILVATKSVEVSNALTGNPTTVFFKEMKANFKSLKTLAMYSKTPYRSKKYYEQRDKKREENEKLYQYILGKIIRINGFFKNAIQRLQALPCIDNRQRVNAIENLSANDYQKWEKYFSKVYYNLKKIYPRTEFSFQREKLMDKYENDWKKILNEAKENCKRFAQKFDEIINEKPRTAFHYSRLVQSVMQLNFEILSATATQHFIYYSDLEKKAKRIQELVNKTFVNYTSEKEFLTHYLSILNNHIAIYVAQMKKKQYTDYKDDIKNKALLEIIAKQIVKNISAQIGTENFAPQKQLCVRIFPDEIFVQQHNKLLTKQEMIDGKRFWIQWYIASKNEIYEKEAWNMLWRKYNPMRASWIARSLYPKLWGIRTHRPYLNNDNMQKSVAKLIEVSNSYDMSETYSKLQNENNIHKCIKDMHPHFYKVREIVMQYDKIVDYLYQKLITDLEYVERRISSFIMFYDKHPELKKPDTMDFVDSDYQLLISFYKELKDLIFHIQNREIALEEMIDEYLRRLDVEDVFFPPMHQFRDPDVFAPPTSAIMPDRFVFYGNTTIKVENKERKKKIVFAGRKVKRNLKLGVDLSEDERINPYKLNKETGEIEARGGIRWMTDYETAVKSGMAITVPLPHNDEQFSKAKFSSIYVLGIKEDSSENVLEDFFTGHIYGQSNLEFLKIGTPTNSFDDIISGYNSDEADLEEKRYNIEIKRAYEKSDSLFDSSKRIFGKGRKRFNDTIGRANSSDNTEIHKAKLVNELMTKILANNFIHYGKNTVLDCRTKLFLRNIPNFVKNHCFARGVFPPIRVGNQPYGIMPTTAFSKFEFEAQADRLAKEKDPNFLQFARELHQLLKRISDIWTKIKKEKVISFENLTRGNAQKRYIEMMGLTPISVAYYERTMIESLPILHPLINYHQLENSNRSLGKILKNIFQISTIDENNAEILDHFGIFKSHPIAEMAQELVNENNIPDLSKFVNEITKKLSESDKQLIKDLPKEELHLLITEFMDLFTYRLDAWWLGLVNYQLYRIRNGVFGRTQKNSIGAFGWLFNLEKGKKGNKKSAQEQKIICTEMNLSDKETPIYQDENHNEFILAPSINHAITAAVIRSSYKNSMKGDDNKRLNINLSSMRVRQALRLIEGVRNGLSVGTVLGTDLERNMHEYYKFNKNVELDRYIHPLRKQFPLKVDIKPQQSEDEAQPYTMTVINGEALLSKIQREMENDTQPIADYLKTRDDKHWFTHLLGANTLHKSAMAILIEQMADSYDALGDLVLSESVYQLVQGNRVKFSALMKNMEDGKVITDPEVTEIPMQSAVIRHKTVLALKIVSDMEVKGWDSVIYRENTNNETIIETSDWAMANAEPTLNYWIGTQLGSAEEICFTVKVAESVEDKEVEREKICTLSDLGISPLEYYYLSSNQDIFARFVEIAYRKKFLLTHQKVTIDFHISEQNDNCRSLLENEWMLNGLRKVLANSTSLSAEHFTHAHHGNKTENFKGFDTHELKSRYSSLLDYCVQFKEDLRLQIQKYSSISSLRNTFTTDDFHQITKTLLNASSLGISEALTSLPQDVFVHDAKDEKAVKKVYTHLFKTLTLIEKLLAEKIENAKKQLKNVDFEDENIMVSAYTEAMQSLLTKNFKIIPHFVLTSLPDTDKKAYEHQLENDFSYSNVSPMRLETWTTEVAKVREPMENLQTVRVFSDFLGIDQGKTTAVQMPFHPEKDKEWLGLEVSSEDLVEDKDTMVIYNSQHLSTDISVIHAGLVIDQWMELIPYQHQRGGVVFNFDQPNAEAPQVVLLAIPAKITMRKNKKGRYQAKKWTLDELITTLNDTRIMAENRAVEPDHLYAEADLAKIFPLLKY